MVVQKSVRLMPFATGNLIYEDQVCRTDTVADPVVSFAAGHQFRLGCGVSTPRCHTAANLKCCFLVSVLDTSDDLPTSHAIG
jgi:hypothetical protein